MMLNHQTSLSVPGCQATNQEMKVVAAPHVSASKKIQSRVRRWTNICHSWWDTNAASAWNIWRATAAECPQNVIISLRLPNITLLHSSASRKHLRFLINAVCLWWFILITGNCELLRNPGKPGHGGGDLCRCVQQTGKVTENKMQCEEFDETANAVYYCRLTNKQQKSQESH